MAIIRVRSLVENTADMSGLLAEHGLAMWIETPNGRVLFDTGQGLAIMHNAQAMGIDLADASAIVLSHGHYDHTGGLAAALARASGAPVYAHPEAFARRYARNADGTSREIGIREADKEAVHQVGRKVVETGGPAEVVPGVFVTGPVPRANSYEDTGGPFFLDPDCQRPDPIEDDQALYFDSSHGAVILLGCAHAGVINTIDYVRHLTGNRPIHAVIGGMHLRNADHKRLNRTYEALRRLNPDCLCPAHCTGTAAVAEMWNLFRGRCGPWSVGTEMRFKEM